MLDFGGRSGTIDVARQTAVAADLTHNSTVENTILQVERAAFAYLSARAQRDAEKVRRSTWRPPRSTRRANDIASASRRSPTCLQAQTARSQAELDLETARGSAAGRARRARRRDGSRREHAVRDPRRPGDGLGVLRGAVGRFADRARRFGTGRSWPRARAEAAAASSQIKVARSGYLPALAFSADRRQRRIERCRIRRQLVLAHHRRSDARVHRDSRISTTSRRPTSSIRPRGTHRSHSTAGHSAGVHVLLHDANGHRPRSDGARSPRERDSVRVGGARAVQGRRRQHRRPARRAIGAGNGARAGRRHALAVAHVARAARARRRRVERARRHELRAVHPAAEREAVDDERTIGFASRRVRRARRCSRRVLQAAGASGAAGAGAGRVGEQDLGAADARRQRRRRADADRIGPVANRRHARHASCSTRATRSRPARFCSSSTRVRSRPRLRQAEAALARDQAQAQSLQRDAERYKTLVEKDYVTKSQADQARSAAAAMQATVQSDKAAVDNARLNLEYATIRSPIAGRTGRLLVRRGNVVRANSDALVVINQLRPILVRFPVVQHDFPALQRRTAAADPCRSASSRPTAEGSTRRAPWHFSTTRWILSRGSVSAKARFQNQRDVSVAGRSCSRQRGARGAGRRRRRADARRARRTARQLRVRRRERQDREGAARIGREIRGHG